MPARWNGNTGRCGASGAIPADAHPVSRPIRACARARVMGCYSGGIVPSAALTADALLRGSFDAWTPTRTPRKHAAAIRALSVDRLGWMPPSLQHAEPPRPLRKLVINGSPADANARSVLNARIAPAPTRCAVQLDHLRGGEAVASIASRWSRPGSSRHAKIRRLRLRHWSTSSILGSRT
jgi:hypothetical protein